MLTGDYGAFSILKQELARWPDAGLTPHVWLRDDDLIAPTEALDKLATLTGSHGCWPTYSPSCLKEEQPVMLRLIFSNGVPQGMRHQCERWWDCPAAQPRLTIM